MANHVLNRRQMLFASEYQVDGNAKQAAIRAGYSAQSAEFQGQALLKHPRVSELIESQGAALAQQLTKATLVTKEWLAAEGVHAVLMAKKAGKIVPMVRALEFLARLHGHLVERRDVRIIRSVEDLSDEELGQLLIETRRDTSPTIEAESAGDGADGDGLTS